MNAVDVRHVTVLYKEKPVLWDVSFSVPNQTITAIVGPNGAGKTTLIKAIAGLLKPLAGSITFSKKIHDSGTCCISYVPQRQSVDWDFPISVLDVVLMGRFSSSHWFKRVTKEDRDRAYHALSLVEMTTLAQRPIAHLSGGQQQRVFLARALVQDSPLMILDEPLSGIDAATEATIVEILLQQRDQGKTILMVLHDLPLIDRYCDWVALINGTCIGYGAARTMIQPHLLHETYGKKDFFHASTTLQL